MRRSRIAGPTPAQDAFCQQFTLNGGNARLAYWHAFPKSRTAKHGTICKHASRLLKLPHVQERIAHYQAIARGRADEAFKIEADRVLQHLLAIAESRATDFMAWGVRTEPVHRDGEVVGMVRVPWLKIKPSDELTPAQAGVVKSVTRKIERDGSAHVTIELHDRLTALHLLGKNLGLFGTTVQHTGRIETTPIVLKVTPSEPDA